jgi:predicted MFS family arabinose efflux permease
VTALRKRWRTRFDELKLPFASRPFRFLWSANIVSALGSWAARLALGLLVLERTGSPALTGMIVTVTLLPWLGLGQYLATFGDRLDRRTIVVVADVARAALHGTIALVDVPIPVLFLLAFLAGSFDPPFQASVSAMLPRLLSRGVYPHAVRVRVMSGQAASLIGFAAGGGLSAVLGPQGALGVDAVSFLLSAYLLGRLPAMPAERRSEEPPGIRAGFGILRRDRLVRHALMASLLAVIPGAAVETQVPVYAVDVARESAAAAGALAMMIPAGTILGTLLIRGLADDQGLLTRSGLLAAIGGAGAFVGFAAEFGWPGAIIPFLFTGILFAGVVPGNIVAGQRIPDHVRASAMGLFQGMIMGAFVVGTTAAGAAAEQVGVAITLALFGLMGIAAGIWIVVFVPRVEEPVG